MTSTKIVFPLRSPQDVRLRNGTSSTNHHSQKSHTTSSSNKNNTNTWNGAVQTPMRQQSASLLRRASPQHFNSSNHHNSGCHHGNCCHDEKSKYVTIGRSYQMYLFISLVVLLFVGSIAGTIRIHKTYFASVWTLPDSTTKQQASHPSQLLRTSQLLTSSASSSSSLIVPSTPKDDQQLQRTEYLKQKEQPIVQYHTSPRIVYMDHQSTWTDDEWLKRRHATIMLDMKSNHTGIENENEQWEYHQDTSNGDGQCIPKADWQTKSFPNCNTVHEINFASAAARVVIDTSKISSNNVSLSYNNSTSLNGDNEDDLSLLGEGWFRTTWQLDRTIQASLASESTKHHHHEAMNESVVLKTLRIEREYLSEYYELHRRDAVAMERLTGSNFVVNVYGYCGQSAINELANFHFPGIQNLESFNRRLRGLNTPKSAIMKLQMAASIALGVADIHAAGENSNNNDIDSHHQNHNNAYMVHYDLNPRNIALFSGGRPKINDFNIAEFLRYDPKTNKTCGFPSRLHEPWWRAPEEMNTKASATKDIVLIDETVDLYALGNILYHTLTSHAPWGKMKKERIPDVQPKVARGEHPEIPKLYTHDKDRHIKALVKAINMCWVFDPTKRATAEDVAAVLYAPLLSDNHDHDTSSSTVHHRDSKNEIANTGPMKQQENLNSNDKQNGNKNGVNNDDDDEDEGNEVEDKNAFGH